MESDGAATGPKGPRFRWRGHAARNLLLNLFCCQRTENWLYEGRAVETSSVHRCSSTLAAVDTTSQALVKPEGCRTFPAPFPHLFRNKSLSSIFTPCYTFSRST